MTFAYHDTAKFLGIAVAVASLGMTFPASAAADATDDAFMHKLFADALDFAPPELAVPRARVVCDAFRANMSPEKVHSKILNTSAFTATQAAVFMADAVSAYCPSYAGLFTS